ncbi:DUF305 domain-containing protein [Neorhizobium sp. Rsf11]|uniref:DUF305 domain-containing protein n=2 Tax=Neorhizobium TaxID=1525371 RepID=A0ABV0LZA5_9HYPH|nr:DUF305 domain-containing protein [Neorhizobium petrolearium]MCC2610908.1 DUF305 domain-containing protein [Neorhizobium petrolearium]WGI71022.1 DUF305 domain-containing protein [Neorhizobium petrolearium]
MTHCFCSTRVLATTSLLAVISVSAFAHDAPAHHHEAAAGTADESPFLQENDAAMVKMMNDMAVKPTGDVDRDFVEMMIPHHQGAIDMAVAYLRYGNNEQLKRLAQEIIVDQQQEIAAMRIAVGDPLPASDAVPTQVKSGGAKTTQSSEEETSSRAPTIQMMMKPAN